MRELGDRWGFRVAAAVFPVSVQVESRFADDRPQRRFRALAEALGIPSVDLLPVLAAAPGRLFYDHCHLTPAGNDAVAGPLADFVRAIAPRGREAGAYRLRTVSTGQGASCTTRSATLPRKNRENPVRPWVPMTIRSARLPLAVRTI